MNRLSSSCVRCLRSATVARSTSSIRRPFPSAASLARPCVAALSSSSTSSSRLPMPLKPKPAEPGTLSSTAWDSSATATIPSGPAASTYHSTTPEHTHPTPAIVEEFSLPIKPPPDSDSVVDIERSRPSFSSSSSTSSSSSSSSTAPASSAPDITQLIMDDHQWFRQQFAELDEVRARSPRDAAAIGALWQPLADRLDTHAVAEEEIFYPKLLAKGKLDPKDATLDAIKDHNKIRDGIRKADQHKMASEPWWQAVDETRAANDEHMGEEENEGLPDFRRHASPAMRQQLGDEFSAFMRRHRGARGIDHGDKDPKQYVRQHQPAPRAAEEEQEVQERLATMPAFLGSAAAGWPEDLQPPKWKKKE